MAATAPVIDERKHRDALIAALAPLQAFEPGMVPGLDDNPVRAGRNDPPQLHALVFLNRRTAETRNSTARATRSAWRAVIRATGRTPDEVRDVETKVSNALEGSRLAIADDASTPVTHETTDQAIAKSNDGWFFRDTSYTYVL